MRALILVVLVSCSLLCRAEAELPLLPQAKAAFERHAPGRRFHDDAIAFGDLNGDGVTDFVTFVGHPNSSESGVETLKIAVFLGAKGNAFHFFAESLDVFGHPRAFHLLDVKKQSIFLHRDGSGGCCSHWVEEFQFKIRDGQLMLIGSETGTFYPEGSTEPDTGVSANLLTGRVRKWTGTGKNRREKTTVVPALKPIPFKDFDYHVITDKWASVLW